MALIRYACRCGAPLIVVHLGQRTMYRCKHHGTVLTIDTRRHL